MSLQKLPSATLDARFCDLLLAWDALEQKLDGPTLIDQNMIGGQAKTSYVSRKDVEYDLKRLRDDYPHSDGYGRQLDRLIFYVNDMMSPDKVDMPERIEKMLGVKFEPFSDDIISNARITLTERAAALGMTFGAELDKEMREAEPFVEDEKLLSIVDAIYQNGLRKFHRRTGLRTKSNYSFEIVVTDANWAAYSSGELDHFLIRINKRNPDNLRQENMARLIRHELLGHATYHTENLHRIRAGELPSSAGLILLPGADLLADEGCAEIAGSLYCTSPLGFLNEAMLTYGKLCQAQAVHTQWQHSTEQAVEQYMDLMPYGNIERLRKQLTHASDDLFWRYYLWSYPAARTFFQDAFASMDSKNFSSFLKDCYTTPRDVPDLAVLAHSHGMSSNQIHRSLRPASNFAPEATTPECQHPSSGSSSKPATNAHRYPSPER